MAIPIQIPPEPLSRNSLLPKYEPLLIESRAYRLLRQELRRYCAGDVNGRSFLISGHRGAGKTTLVASAFLSVLGNSEGRGEHPDKKLLRPLYVPLHGPNLLPDPGRASTPAADVPDAGADAGQPGAAGANTTKAKAAAATPEKTAGAKPAPDGTSRPATQPTPKDRARDETDPETQEALVQITLALHRAVCRELSEHYHRRLLQPHSRSPTAQQRALELAAQLELELYQWPTAARLREFWARADVLQAGVLPSSREDQGLLELVALSAVCDAYRRISGTLSQTETASDEGTQSADATLSFNAAGKDFYGPLVTLLTGGVVGAGTATLTGNPALAAFAGAATALTSAVTMKGTSTRSRTRSRSREDNFLFDLSVATLDRILPLLIDALLRCGLAPIFVVDELDKVVNLQGRMVGMVQHLKKFVAERAFFCFLTDRLYFEQMEHRDTTVAFSPEYTYFTHRLFVVFRPAQLHDYLDNVFEATPASPTPPTSTTPTTDDSDRKVLPYVILHRARMHAIDVQREIAQLRNDKDEVGLPAGTIVSSPLYRFDVMIQLAIEMVLAGDRLHGELDRDPTFYRIAYDALYYLSERWKAGEPVHLGKDHQGAFDKYLDDRIGGDQKKPEAPPAGPASPAAPAPGKRKVRPTSQPGQVEKADAPKIPQALKIPQVTKDFLFERVNELADLLADSESYGKRWKTFNEWRQAQQLPPVPPVVFDALSLTDLDPPLLVSEHGGYVWGYDQSGQPLREGSLEARKDQWEADADNVELFDKALRTLLGSANGLDALASTYSVVPVSPAWTQVTQSIARLRRRDTGGTERGDHRILAGYASMLDANAEAIGSALLSAAVLVAIGGGSASSEEMARALLLVTSACRLRHKVEGEVQESLETLWTELAERFSLTKVDLPYDLEPLVNQTDVTVQLPFKEVATAVRAKKTDVASAIRSAWESVARRAQAVGASPANTPNTEELICAARREGPSKFVQLDLSEMTFASWSGVFVACFIDDGAPPWFAPVALLNLGFGVENARRTFPGDVPSAKDPVPKRFQLISIGIPAEPAILVIKAPRDSVVDSLPPSPTRRVAGLALKSEDLSRARLVQYLKALGEHSGEALFSQLAVEVQTLPPQAPNQAEQLRPAILAQGAPTLFFSKAEFKDAQPPVRTVTSLDQLRT